MKRRHKYHAQPTTVGGVRYASKAEARYAQALAIAKESGVILGWTRQHPFYFANGSKYVCDFSVWYADGHHEFVEVKGVETQVWKLKMKMMAAEYPWAEVKVVK